MKKILFSESAKALALAFTILVSYAGNIMAQATVSEPDANGVVTITTTEAGQIGELEGPGYALVGKAFVDIPTTTKIKVCGPINDGDVNTLLWNHGKKNLTSLDMSEAEIDHFTGVDFSDYNHPKGTFVITCASELNKEYLSMEMLALPKVTSKTQTTIPLNLFNNNKRFYQLKKLVISEGVTAIEGGGWNGVFGEYKEMTELVLPEGLKEIGSYAFTQCRKLENIVLPASLERVDANAFYQNSFHTVVFPQNVKYLGHESFWSYRENNVCNLTDVYFQGLVAPECEKGVFNDGSYNGYGGSKTLGEKAVRDDYVNADGYKFCVLHYRADLTDAQKETYTDLTRSYSIPDLYLAENRTWPTQDEYTQAYNNVTWNGTRFDGSSLSEEQKKHLGILQFVLAIADAPKPSNTPGVVLPVMDDDWWTLCVPFDMDAEEVAATFGENARIYTLGEVVRNESKRLITLKFNKKFETIKAHMPYLIKPSKKFGEGENPKFALVAKHHIQGGSEQEVNVTAIDQYGSETDYVYTFVGNYGGDQNWIQNTSEAKECKASGTDEKIVYNRPNNCYYLSFTNGKVTFKYQGANKSGRWTPYSAIVTVSKVSDRYDLIDDSFRAETGEPTLAKYSSTSIGDWGETTSVEQIEIETPSETTDNNVYNMNGQVVRKNSTSLAGLTQGVYLINGKKYIVK